MRSSVDACIIHERGTYALEHHDDVLGVVEGPDVRVVAAVHDGHRLQAQHAQVLLRREQEPVVQVVEELGRPDDLTHARHRRRRRPA